MSSASKRYADRSKRRRGAGALNRHKGNRRFYLPCKASVGCLLGLNHVGCCYMGVD